MNQPEVWFVAGGGLFVLPFVLRHLYQLKRSQTAPAEQPAWENNPLDVRLDFRVSERHFTEQQTIHLQVPGEEGTISVKLHPAMRGKVIRLRDSLKDGVGHLFLRVLVAEGERFESDADSAPEKSTFRDYETGEKPDCPIRRLRLMVMGDEQKVEALIEYEHTRSPYLSREECARMAIDRWER